jgi:hypothetical protein
VCQRVALSEKNQKVEIEIGKRDVEGVKTKMYTNIDMYIDISAFL